MDAGVIDHSLARRIYDLHLEHVYLRALRAVSAQREAGAPDALAELERALAGVESAIEDAEATAGAVPMRRLATRFVLDAVDCDLLWAAVAAAADPRLFVHAGALIGSDARRGLSLALYSLIAGLDGPTGFALGLRMTPAHPVLRYQLLEPGDRQFTGSAVALRASTRLASYLAGDDALEQVLMASGGQVGLPEHAIFDSMQESALHRMSEALASKDPLILVVEGPPGAGRRTAVATVASRMSRVVVAIDVKRLAPTHEALEDALAALRREVLLSGSLGLVAEVDDLVDVGPEGSGRVRGLARVLDDFPGPVILTSSRPGLDLGLQRGVLRVEWPVADTASRRALWRHYLGSDSAGIDEGAVSDIALRYRLGAGGIERAAATARLLGQARAQGGGLQPQDLVAGIRNNIAEHLGNLARRVEVKQKWDDLVLSPDLMDQIHALVARVRHAHQVYEDWGFSNKAARGIGVPVLFSGPPGTGKTMVAGIIARELDLELLQVDLSQVVSKWVGETEKQLSRVFDAAEAGHALLLFDEADALFAKRTEVKGATDRYANLEVNYLLQRVESFGGITILTTNLESSIDQALKRRLAGHIVFWPPDEEEREQLWHRLLDTGSAPVDSNLDLGRLARSYPDMTGANIRNAVLAAAFLAAAESQSITQDHLERAAKGEYRTMGRLLR